MNTATKPIHGENKRAHLAMIQGVINRMGGNLFFLKGWAVTLIVALFAATVSFDGNLYLRLAPAVAILFFWGFDAYFLSLERCYRNLYDEIREKNEDEIDFSMDFHKFKKLTRNTWVSALFSKTLLAFYPLMGLIMFALIKII